MKYFKPAIGILIICMASVAVLAVGSVAYLKTDHARRWFTAKINESLAGSVVMDSHSFSLMKGQIELNGFQLWDASGENLAGFERLLADISWGSLAKGNLRLTSVLLKRPRSDIRMDASGTVNIFAAFAAQRTPSPPIGPEKKPPILPFNVIVDSLVLMDGSFRFVDEKTGARIAVEDLDVEGSGDVMQKTARLSVELRNIDLAMPHGVSRLDIVGVKAKYRDGNLDILSSEIKGPPLSAALKGTIAGVLSHPRLDMVLDAGGTVENITKIFGVHSGVAGNIAARLAVTGSLKNPAADLALDFPHGTVHGMPFEQGTARLKLRDRRVTIDTVSVNVVKGKLDVTGQIDMSQAFPDGTLVSPFHPDALAYRIDLNGYRLDLHHIPVAEDNWTGVVDLLLSINGRGLTADSIEATATGELTGSRMAAVAGVLPVGVAIQTSIRLSGGQVEIKDSRLRIANTTLRSQGRYDRATQAVTADMRLSSPDLGASLAPFGIKDAGGRVELNGRLSGTVRRPALEIRMEATELGFHPVRLGNVSLDARIDEKGVLEIHTLGVENSGSAVSGSGRLQIFTNRGDLDPTLPLQFSAKLDHVDVNHFYSQDNFSGRINGELSAAGPLRNLVAEAQLTAENIVLSGIRLGEIDAHLRWVDGKLIAEPLILKNRDSRFRATGSVQLFSPGTTVFTDDPDLRLFAEADPIQARDFTGGITGVFRAKARIQGRMKHPVGIIEVQGSGIDTGVQKLASMLLSARLDGEKLFLDEMKIDVAPGESVSGTGWIAMDKQFGLELSSTGISLDHIDRLRGQDIARGKLQIELSASGSIGNPEANGKLVLNDLLLNRKPVDDMIINLHMADGLATVQGNPNFNLEGAYQLGKKDFSSSLQFQGTDLSPFLNIAGYAEYGGAVTGSMIVSGNSDHPEKIHARIDLTDLSVSHKHTALIRSGRVSGTYEDRHLNLADVHLELLTGGHLDLRGKAGPTGDVDIAATGRVPLAGVAPFIGAIANPEGIMDLSVKISGTPQQPSVNGQIDLAGIGFDLPETGQKLRNGVGRIRLTPGSVVLEDLHGQVDSGRFELAGRAELLDFTPGNMVFTLKCHHIPIRIPDTLFVLLDSDLVFEGDPAASHIRGEVVILDGEYIKDVNLNILQGMMEKKRKSPVRQPAEPMPILEKTVLDIAVRRTAPFRVDNNLAQLEISPDLKVTGSLARPVVLGRAGIDAGTLRYRKRQFEITGGAVDFVNPYRIEPTVRLQGETRVRDWTISLKVEGTPDALKFNLSSDPSADDGDILSLLLFGRTTRELIDGEGGTSGSPEQMLAGMLATTMEKEIRDSTGLDIFEVDAAEKENAGETGGGIRVTVGKKLTDRIAVKYAAESRSGGLVPRVIAEYKLLENIIINGYQESRGAFGGELRYRLEFR